MIIHYSSIPAHSAFGWGHLCSCSFCSSYSEGRELCPAHSKFPVMTLAESSRLNIIVGETDGGKNNRPQIILLTLYKEGKACVFPKWKLFWG